MAAPLLTSITYDKPGGYNPGDLITVTLQGAAGTQLASQVFTGTGTLTDKATGQTGSLKSTFTISSQPAEDATAASFADVDANGNATGRIWTPVSLSQSAGGAVTAVFTSTA